MNSNSNNITEAFDLAYNRDTSFHRMISLWIRNEQGNFHEIGCVPLEQFNLSKLKIHPTSDYYITPNTLKKAQRVTDNLFSLLNIVVDIDYHSDNAVMTPQGLKQQLDNFLYRLARDSDIPTPNIVHFTGRGMQLWWCIEETAKDLLFLWNWAVDRILFGIEEVKKDYPEFSLLEVDKGASKKSAGLFRLFGTYNTKTGKQTVVEIHQTEIYRLNDLLQSCPEIPKEESIILPAHPMFASGKEISNESYAALNDKRAKFIEWLVSERNAPAGVEMRDIPLFLYYNALVQIRGRDSAKEAALALNQRFKEPKESLDYIFDYIDKKGFLQFRNATWFSYLQLTKEEIAKYNERGNSNYSRDQRRAEAKRERNEKILELKRRGMSNVAIAAELGVSRNTVAAVLRAGDCSKTDIKKQILKLLEEGYGKKDICEKLDIDKNVYYRTLKQ